jgi:hypothetical protein
MRKITFLFVFALILTSLSALAADRVITNGIDPWVTAGNGMTFSDFSKNPIPAGFFCASSAPFAERVAYRGVPLATGVPGTLNKTDTIIQRLDDATFNRQGVAVTRIQVRALEFEGVAPIKTSCGQFKVTVMLNGEQPITRMKIVRQSEQGGIYVAPISVNVKIVFTPIGRGTTEALELYREFRFPPTLNAKWTFEAGRGATRHAGMVLVDTDADRQPDTYLPGTSNFAAGFAAAHQSSHEKMATITCHMYPDGAHCVCTADCGDVAPSIE